MTKSDTPQRNGILGDVYWIDWGSGKCSGRTQKQFQNDNFIIFGIFKQTLVHFLGTNITPQLPTSRNNFRRSTSAMYALQT